MTRLTMPLLKAMQIAVAAEIETLSGKNVDKQYVIDIGLAKRWLDETIVMREARSTHAGRRGVTVVRAGSHGAT